MPILSVAKWLLAACSAFIIGLSKSGIPGFSLLFVPLFAQVMPARASTGALLPLLIVGDIFAVAFWRRHAVWRHLARLLPWATAGIVAGWLFMSRLSDAVARPLIGGVVLVMLAANLLQELRLLRAAPAAAGIPGVPTGWWFAAAFGVTAGFTTMVANAAGAVMTVYLLAMRLPKEEFIGTTAWFFLVVNLIKVPFSAGLGLITAPSLSLDALLAGAVVVGSVVGILVARRIPQRAFSVAVQALAAVTAVLMFL